MSLSVWEGKCSMIPACPVPLCKDMKSWMPQCHMTLLQNIIKFAKKSPTQITNTRREMTVEQFITSLARSLTSCPRVAVSGNGMRMRRGKRRNTASSSSPGLARLSAQQSWKKMFFRFFSIQNHINHIISIISSPFEVRCEIAEESQETCPKPEDSQSEVKVSNLQLQDDGGSSFDVFDLAEMQINRTRPRSPKDLKPPWSDLFCVACAPWKQLRLFVAPSTKIRVLSLVPAPSNWTRNSVFNRRAASCSPLERLVNIESISSCEFGSGNGNSEEQMCGMQLIMHLRVLSDIW